MKSLLLIKLGGSVITDKAREFTARQVNIKRFAHEIAEGQKVFSGAIVVGHGAGSFAHTPAKKYQTKDGLINSSSLLGAAVVEDAARRLNAILVAQFLSENLPVFPFSPGSFLFSDTQRAVKSLIDPVLKALEVGLMPMVYGDVVIDKKQGVTIFSTEKVFSVLAQKLKKSYKIRMIYVTDVNGVYDENGITIPVISRQNFGRLKASITGAKNVDVTGGMLHKVEEALNLADKFRIETLIINGNIGGNLKKAIKNEKIKGTLILNVNS